MLGRCRALRGQPTPDVARTARGPCSEASEPGSELFRADRIPARRSAESRVRPSPRYPHVQTRAGARVGLPIRSPNTGLTLAGDLPVAGTRGRRAALEAAAGVPFGTERHPRHERLVTQRWSGELRPGRTKSRPSPAPLMLGTHVRTICGLPLGSSTSISDG